MKRVEVFPEDRREFVKPVNLGVERIRFLRADRREYAGIAVRAGCCGSDKGAIPFAAEAMGVTGRGIKCARQLHRPHAKSLRRNKDMSAATLMG